MMVESHRIQFNLTPEGTQMHKSPLAFATAAIMTLLLVTACAEEGKTTAITENAEAPVTEKTKTLATVKTQATQSTAEKSPPKEAGQDAPIMNQPVDFSTPENVAKTMQAIKEQAGGRAARKIDSVMGYMMTYDLGVGRDEAKMYKKLNGKTPNQIIAMGSARR